MSRLMLSAPLTIEQVADAQRRIAKYSERLSKLDVVGCLRHDISMMISDAEQSLMERWPYYVIDELLDAIRERIKLVSSNGGELPLTFEVGAQRRSESSLPPPALE